MKRGCGVWNHGLLKSSLSEKSKSVLGGELRGHLCHEEWFLTAAGCDHRITQRYKALPWDEDDSYTSLVHYCNCRVLSNVRFHRKFEGREEIGMTLNRWLNRVYNGSCHVRAPVNENATGQCLVPSSSWLRADSPICSMRWTPRLYP